MSPAKFQEIKEDFENIQRLEDEIIKIYTTSKKINYAKISGDAESINTSALRLRTNLFPAMDAQKKGAKPKQNKGNSSPLPEDLKSLIVEQDNMLAAFVANPMFANPKVVNSNDNAKAQTDLDQLIRLSSALKAEADRAAIQ